MSCGEISRAMNVVGVDGGAPADTEKAITWKRSMKMRMGEDEVEDDYGDYSGVCVVVRYLVQTQLDIYSYSQKNSVMGQYMMQMGANMMSMIQAIMMIHVLKTTVSIRGGYCRN